MYVPTSVVRPVLGLYAAAAAVAAAESMWAPAAVIAVGAGAQALHRSTRAVRATAVVAAPAVP